MIEENFIRKLIASIKCGSCGQSYEDSHMDIIERNDELWFVRVVCSSCRSGCMVAAIIREDRRPESVTDLNEEEMDRFNNTGGISEDDLLDMHEFLKNFDGDFPRVFRRY